MKLATHQRHPIAFHPHFVSNWWHQKLWWRLNVVNIDKIFITGSCHFDNFQCSQWWKFFSIWRHWCLSEGTVKSVGGHQVHAPLITPNNHQPSKKSPTLPQNGTHGDDSENQIKSSQQNWWNYHKNLSISSIHAGQVTTWTEPISSKFTDATKKLLA